MSEPADTPDVIKAVTYNVHGCVGTDGVKDPRRIAAVLRALEPDIVGLQEVDARVRSRTGQDQLEEIAAETGLHPVAGPARYEADGFFGNALLTRFPVEVVSHADLSVHGREPRALLDVKLKVRSKTLRTVVTHFGLRTFERRRQVKTLLDIVHQRDPSPLLVLGDFNEWWPRAWALARLRAVLGSAPSVASYPSRYPLFALDRIWVVPTEGLFELSAVRDHLTRRASDHLPVQAIIDALVI